MRIGIDARFLTHPQRGGFKTYTENLIRSIAQVDKDTQYILYVDREPIGNDIPNQSNIDIRIINGHLPLIGMPVREQFSLPGQARKDGVDLFHFLCNTASVNMPGKIVITLHDTIQVQDTQPLKVIRKLSWYKNWFITQYSRQAIMRTMGKANRLITVSEYERSVIATELGIPSSQISVTHLAPHPVFMPFMEQAVTSHRDEIAKKLNIHNKYILGIGYEPRKNIPLLMEAYSKIAQDFPNLDLVIVCANENYRLSFSQLVDKMQLKDQVIILGSLTVDQLAILYNLAEAFVYPSERESFGLPPLEAIACGTPTLAMNSSSLPEILQDGALLISDDSSQVWADAIRKVVTDQDLRKKLIDRGLKRAAEFSWHKCAQETVQVYHQVWNESR